MEHRTPSKDVPRRRSKISPFSSKSILYDSNKTPKTSQWLIQTSNSIPTMTEALTSSDSGSSVERGKALHIDSTVEAKMLSNLLQQARREILKAIEVRPVSKKLLEALLEISVKELCGLPDEEDKLHFLILNRWRILMFIFMALLMISLSVILFSSGFGGHTSSVYYPPPT